MRKPTVKLVGEDGNIFSILGRCRKALQEAGKEEEAETMLERVYKSESYDKALNIVMEYIEVE